MLTTPIDTHLPLIAAIVVVCAWTARRSRAWSALALSALPLLIVAQMTLGDERMRLLAYAVIVTGAFASALSASASPSSMLLVAAIVLLRWIPLPDVHVLKELVVMGGTVALFYAMPRRTPLALIAAAGIALVTPAQPRHMAFLPLAVALVALMARRDDVRVLIGALLLVCAFFARYPLAILYIAAAIVFLLPLLERIRPVAYAAAAVIFLLWPWSGIAARALPLLRNHEEPSGQVRPIARALAASEAMDVEVPAHVRHAVITTSGGQTWRMRRGRVVATVEATDMRGRVVRRPIRIGDTADYAFTARDPFFISRNPLPRAIAADVRGYGATSWVWGGGRVALGSADDLRSLRIAAAADLPPYARLQVDSVEFPSR